LDTELIIGMLKVLRKQLKNKNSDLKEFSPREALIKKGFTKEVMEKNWKEFVEKVLNKKI